MGFRASGVALAMSAALCALPRICLAAGPSAALHVTRSEGASDCPDAASLGADVAHSVGRGAFDVDPSAPPGNTIDVVFSHGNSGYVADITKSDGRTQGAQQIVDASPTCTTLAHAVVATLAVLLDGIVTEPATDPPPPTEAGRPSAAPFDPDDIPPGEPVGSGDRVGAAGAPTGHRGRTRWYGWQILIADFASFGTFVAAAESNGTASTVLAGVSVIGLVSGGAVIHGLHGRGGAAIGSIALRLALPIVGGVIGSAMAPSCPAVPTGPNQTLAGGVFDAVTTAVCPIVTDDYVIMGAFVGWLAASVIDVSALSWDHGGATRPSSGFAPTLSIRPFATLIPASDRRTTGTLGVAGSF